MKTRTLITVVLAVLMLIAGCEEEQVKWGQGDPPEKWQSDFGNDNIARLNFVQSNLIDNHQKLFFGFDQAGPDGKPILDREGKAARVPGLIEYINALEARINALHTDPNTPDIETIHLGTIYIGIGRQADYNYRVASKINEIIEVLNNPNK